MTRLDRAALLLTDWMRHTCLGGAARVPSMLEALTGFTSEDGSRFTEEEARAVIVIAEASRLIEADDWKGAPLYWVVEGGVTRGLLRDDL